MKVVTDLECLGDGSLYTSLMVVGEKTDWQTRPSLSSPHQALQATSRTLSHHHQSQGAADVSHGNGGSPVWLPSSVPPPGNGDQLQDVVGSQLDLQDTHRISGMVFIVS